MSSSSSPPFVAGLELNGRFYHQVVRPLLSGHLPHLRYSAALLGYGSDVLGYDTPMSTDHNWGPRLQLFLDEEGFAGQAEGVDDLLRSHLPPTFAGYPVHFSLPDLADNGVQRPEPHRGGPVNHLLEITTVTRYFRRYLGLDPSAPMGMTDWLVLPEQKLLEVTSGLVYWDNLGTLGAARARFAYYPREVWLLRLAAQWQRISEEEPFVGRCGDVDDDLGSRVVAARLVRDLMRLTFLYTRRYAPYSKWLGTAFVRLPLGANLQPLLLNCLAAADWRTRENFLAQALHRLALEHNRLGITPYLAPEIRPFHGRPFQVLMSDRFARAIADQVRDPDLRRHTSVGAVDQLADCVAIHADAHVAEVLRPFFADAVEEEDRLPSPATIKE